MDPKNPNPQDQPSIENLYQPVDIWKAYIRALQSLSVTTDYPKVPAILKQFTKEAIRNLTLYDVEALQEMNAIPQVTLAPVTDHDILATRAYIRNLHKLKGTDEFPKVPAVLRNLSDDEVDNLDVATLQAFRLMNALPSSNPEQGSLQEMKMRELNQALADFCNRNPELRAITKDPKLYTDPQKMQAFAAHPKIQAFFAGRPDLKRILDEGVARINQPLLDSFPFRIPMNPNASSPIEPYMTHPYGSPDPSQTQNPFGTGMPNAKIDRDLAKAAAQIGEMYTDGSAAIMNSIFESNKKMGEVFRKAGG